MVNSNMAITYRRYFNEDTDEWISKATMIADGKLADPYGVVLIKKAASSGSGTRTGTGGNGELIRTWRRVPIGARRSLSLR